MSVFRALSNRRFYLLPAFLGGGLAVAIGYVSMSHDPQGEFSEDLWHWVQFTVGSGLVAFVAVAIVQFAVLAIIAAIAWLWRVR